MVIAVAGWTVLAFWLAIQGWWMSSVVEARQPAQFAGWATEALENHGPGSAAFVQIENSVVFHQHFVGGADEDSLFATASFSKWITALAVMTLVDQQRVDLDRPVEHYLTRWQLPDSAFDHDQVTVRRLLSHTAGLTDRLGFGDYRREEVLPDLVESLRHPRASSDEEVRIAVGLEPGSEFLYSGGGYLILELLVEELSGIPFADYVREVVLRPLGMDRSTHGYLGDQSNAVPSYSVDGSLAPTFRYASAAATAFASTAQDLAGMVRRLLSDGGPLISTDLLTAMRQPEAFAFGAGIWGLGTMLYAPTPQGDVVYGHDGANDPAINVTVRVNPSTSAALVVLVSGHPSLASDIGSEWVLWQTGYPDILSLERAMQSALLPLLIGTLLILSLAIAWARTSRNQGSVR